MNRMIKLFQQKSNRKFDEYLLAKKKSLSDTVRDDHSNHRHAVTLGQQQDKGYPTIQDVVCSVLKAESACWAKAADLLRKEELSK